MDLLKNWKFYASIAAIVAGILLWLNLPKRVTNTEKQIVEMQKLDIKQTAILDNTVKNQDRLISLHEKQVIYERIRKTEKISGMGKRMS